MPTIEELEVKIADFDDKLARETVPSQVEYFQKRILQLNDERLLILRQQQTPAPVSPDVETGNRLTSLEKKFDALKEDFAQSQIVSSYEVISGICSAMGAFVGLGCMVSSNQEAAYIGGISSTVVGVVSGCYTATSIVSKKLASERIKVHIKAE